MRTKLNWPIEWTINFGQGRVYTSTLGHVWKGDVQPVTVRDAAVQTLARAGAPMARQAAGDLSSAGRFSHGKRHFSPRRPESAGGLKSKEILATPVLNFSDRPMRGDVHGEDRALAVYRMRGRLRSDTLQWVGIR